LNVEKINKLNIEQIKKSFFLLADVACRNEMFIHHRVNGDVLGN